MHERERYFEWLPFLVNGSLGPQEREWMNSYLARHPSLRSQLAFTEAVRRVMREQVLAWMRDVPADVGYAKVARHIAARREQRLEQARRSQPMVQSARGRLAAAWHRPGPSGWRWAQGAVLGLLLSAGVLPLLSTSPRPAEVRSAARGWADGPLLRVTFKPTATEAAMRLALIEARALVVAGPTRLGDYYLKSPPDHLQAARNSLLHSGLVQQVDQVPSLPEELVE